MLDRSPSNYPDEKTRWQGLMDEPIADIPPQKPEQTTVQTSPIKPPKREKLAFNSDRGPRWRERDMDGELFGIDKHTSEEIVRELRKLKRQWQPGMTREELAPIENRIDELLEEARLEAQERVSDYRGKWIDRCHADGTCEDKKHGLGVG